MKSSETEPGLTVTCQQLKLTRGSSQFKPALQAYCSTLPWQEYGSIISDSASSSFPSTKVAGFTEYDEHVIQQFTSKAFQ